MRAPDAARARRELRRCATLAWTCLGLMLAVVGVSAAIRLGQAATPPLSAGTLLVLRATHRGAASLEFIAVLWLGWLAWRSRAERPSLARGAALAVALTFGLSVLGIAAGQNPAPAASFGNLLGGLALTAVLAWMTVVCGVTARRPAFAAWFAASLLVLQCILGARLSILGGAFASPALPAHAMLGIVLAGGAAWLASREAGFRRSGAISALALFAPVAGFSLLHFESSFAAALLHAAAAALLVAATVRAGRGIA